MAKFKTSRQIASDIRAMISYDVNQGDIAKELRVSRAYLSEFLSGKREVSSAILEALGYEIEPLYRPKPTRSPLMTRGAEGYGNEGPASISGRSLGKKSPLKFKEDRRNLIKFANRRKPSKLDKRQPRSRLTAS